MKPREKLEKYGVGNLEGQDLLAIILGSGIKGIDVFKLSRRVFLVLEEKRENIKIEDLLSIRGIGKVKAMQIISLFELAKRYFFKDENTIRNIGDVLSHISEYRLKKQEHLVVISLDGANRMINKRVVTIGLLNQSLIHPREVFAEAIEERANSIILVHNHPSGSIFPSYEDKMMTNNLLSASKILGINLLDHIIITKDNHFSFRESKLLY